MIKMARGIILGFCLFGLNFDVLAWEISPPGIATDCQATLNAWRADKHLHNFMASHNCYCPSPNQRPVCTPITSPFLSLPVPSRSPSSSEQMTMQMFQSFFSPIFTSLGESIRQSIAPDLQKSHEQQKAFQQKKEEEAKKKALEAWQSYLKNAEEQARREAQEKQKAGQDILSQVKIGSGTFGNYTVIGPKLGEKETLSKIDWSTPRTPGLTSAASETAKEQLLKAIYFSKMAETFLQSGDVEAARFYAGIAFEGGANSPRIIDYHPPPELLKAMDTSKVKGINNKYLKLSSYYRMAIPKLDGLKGVMAKLEEIHARKEASAWRMKELETQIKDLQAQKQTEATNDKTEMDDLIAQALAIKKKAETEYHEALQIEEKLMQEKLAIEKDLQQLKESVLAEKTEG